MKVKQFYKIKDRNIVLMDDTYNFIYKFTPVNSIFGTNTQSLTLIQTMKKLLSEVNMCGSIYLLPQEIDIDKILDYHERKFEENYDEVLKELKEEYMLDLSKNLYDQVYYRYHIYIVFTDNRNGIQKKMMDRFITRETARPSKRFVSNLKFWEEELFKKIKATNLEVSQEKSIQQVNRLFNYIALPLEPKERDNVTNYHSTAYSNYIDYEYTTNGEIHHLYTKTAIAEQYNDIIGKAQNNLINRIQLSNYPVDIVVKFDLVHSKEFKKKMQDKYNEINKSVKKYEKASDTKDSSERVALNVAELAKNIDPAIEQTIFQTQTMFRLRSRSVEQLEQRYQDLQKRLEKTLFLQELRGRQDKLAENLQFYQTTCHEHYHDFNMDFFTSFNYLGGFYIGEEQEGLVVTYGLHNKVPVLIDYEKVLQGKTKTAAPTTVALGETGSGKSQAVNHILISLMLFLGVKVLVIDPKGDRNKLITKLGEKVASHLELGSEECMSGMFDPYFTTNTLKDGLEKAQTLLVQMERMLNPKTSISLKKIEVAHQKMIEKIEFGFYQSANLSNLVDELEFIYPDAVENVVALKNHSHARLFFGNDFVNFKDAFDFSRSFNLITLKGMPNLEDYDKNNVSHQIASLLLSTVYEIAHQFINTYQGKLKAMLIDEFRLYKVAKGAEGSVEQITRIARSNLLFPFIISQELADIPDGILSQTGMYLAGSLKTKEGIQYMLQKLSMEENIEIAAMLNDETKNEGVSEDRKYNFLYVDFNNRKAPCKLKFQSSYIDAFDTKLKKSGD